MQPRSRSAVWANDTIETQQKPLSTGKPERGSKKRSKGDLAEIDGAQQAAKRTKTSSKRSKAGEESADGTSTERASQNDKKKRKKRLHGKLLVRGVHAKRLASYSAFGHIEALLGFMYPYDHAPAADDLVGENDDVPDESDKSDMDYMRSRIKARAFQDGNEGPSVVDSPLKAR